MGKRAQVRRQKQFEAEKERKQVVEQIKRSRQPWLIFWRQTDFWIYIACLFLLIAFPFLSPKLEKYKNKPAIKSAASNEAVLHTSLGDIDIEFYAKDAPKTVENFVKLSKQGFYNNLTFHRIIKDFMIQGGDPSGNGTGGPGYTFPDEINSHKIVAGTVAMANSGPNTNGSQFFIVTEQPQPHLDGKHTVFGEVKKGMEIVRAIAAVEVDEKDKPKEPVVIQSVEIR